MKTLRRLRVSIAAIAIVTAPLCAVAQQAPASPDPDKLFDEATKALDRKNYDEACPKLEQVIQMKPEAVGARIELGQCYEDSGRLARAWTVYTKAGTMAADAKQTSRVQKVAERTTALRARIGMLTVEVPQALRKLPGIRTVLDGVALTEEQWGKAVAVEKGPHTLVTSATGHEQQSLAVDVSRGGMDVSVTVAGLVALAPTSATGSEAVHAQPAATPTSASEPRSKVPAFVTGGLGLAGLVAGAALVGIAVGTPGDIESKLPRDANGKSLCTRGAKIGEESACAELRSTAQSGSTLGNVGIGVMVGGGVLVTAAVIYLILPAKKALAVAGSTSQVFPVVSRDGGGLVWTGSF